MMCFLFFFFKQKTAYEMRISDWSSDVCSSDLGWTRRRKRAVPTRTVWVLHDYGSLPGRDLDRSGRRRGSCEKPLETLDILVQTPTNWCTLGTCSRKIGRASCRARVCQYV